VLDVATIRDLAVNGWPGTGLNESVRSVRSAVLREASADLPPPAERARAAADPRPGALYLNRPAQIAWPLPGSLSGLSNPDPGLSRVAYEASAALVRSASGGTTALDVLA
jgi:hypothetical protein